MKWRSTEQTEVGKGGVERQHFGNRLRIFLIQSTDCEQRHEKRRKEEEGGEEKVRQEKEEEEEEAEEKEKGG